MSCVLCGDYTYNSSDNEVVFRWTGGCPFATVGISTSAIFGGLGIILMSDDVLPLAAVFFSVACVIQVAFFYFAGGVWLVINKNKNTMEIVKGRCFNLKIIREYIGTCDQFIDAQVYKTNVVQDLWAVIITTTLGQFKLEHRLNCQSNKPDNKFVQDVKQYIESLQIQRNDNQLQSTIHVVLQSTPVNSIADGKSNATDYLLLNEQKGYMSNDEEAKKNASDWSIEAVASWMESELNIVYKKEANKQVIVEDIMKKFPRFNGAALLALKHDDAELKSLFQDDLANYYIVKGILDKIN